MTWILKWNCHLRVKNVHMTTGESTEETPDEKLSEVKVSDVSDTDTLLTVTRRNKF